MEIHRPPHFGCWYSRLLVNGLVVIGLLLTACGASPSPAPLPNATAVPPTETVTAQAPSQEPPTATQSPTATLTPAPTNTPTSEPTIPPTYTPTPLPQAITDTFGVPMVLVPAGEFVMGSDHDQAEAKPAHTVYLDTFYIDKFEVTNELYRACADAGACTGGGLRLLRNPVWVGHPVMDVTWAQAQQYCEWRGGSLPTEAQWEKAARGTDQRKFPWGNDPVTCELARYGDCGWMTTRVGTHPKGASPYGAQDMAGNAWEWVYDWYDAKYYSSSPAKNPTGPERNTGWKSERGGAWFYMAGLMTAIWRNHAPPTAHYLYVGFRCAVNP